MCYTMDETLFVKTFGNSPFIRMVDFFLDNKLFDFSKKEIIEELGMSKTTFYKYFPALLELGIITESRRFGKTKLYKLNLTNPIVKKLMEIEEYIIKPHVERDRRKVKIAKAVATSTK